MLLHYLLLQVTWKSLWCIHREFSYESSVGEKNFENRSIFAKVIIEHQVAYFVETHCTYIQLQCILLRHWLLFIDVITKLCSTSRDQLVLAHFCLTGRKGRQSISRSYIATSVPFKMNS